MLVFSKGAERIDASRDMRESWEQLGDILLDKSFVGGLVHSHSDDDFGPFEKIVKSCHAG